MEEKQLSKRIERAKKNLEHLEQERVSILNKQKQEELAENKCSMFLNWVRASHPELVDVDNEDFCNLIKNLHIAFLKHKTADIFENKADLQNHLHTAMDDVSKKISLLNGAFEKYNTLYEMVKGVSK